MKLEIKVWRARRERRRQGLQGELNEPLVLYVCATKLQAFKSSAHV